jgi:copper chaperone CopZ
MNKIILCVGVLLLTLQFSGFSQTNAEKKANKKTLTVQTKVYCDHCKKCESCKARVENKVYELKGIRSVEMNPEKQTIVIVFNSKITDEQKIREQIAAAGYYADDIKASAAQIAGLDDCCRKQ